MTTTSLEARKKELRDTWFLIINHDGYNVGLEDHFNDTYLCFDDQEEAHMIASVWSDFINDCQVTRESGE